MARYWLINTAATAVPLSTHPSPLVITTTLAAAILGVPLFGGGALPAQYYPCGSSCVKMMPVIVQLKIKIFLYSANCTLAVPSNFGLMPQLTQTGFR